ncbi:tetratricopeptide repeat protein [Kordiimonas sp. SCSIO 12603]|uniref:tetratricopeptide repeat protein n=1 Tax=Kordiimonas sp. SCSIO 12603 TaxID=2829596 RepID=UPI0021044FBF|nr:tetratricopeptide repeat protein [Kordiimonas sp. SCSIO 12603]UTW57629.1 tetratricopeptide repeat protein [Kordiimonas sp. SCSIO 12603]
MQPVKNDEALMDEIIITEEAVKLPDDPLAADGLQVPDLLDGRDVSSVVNGISSDLEFHNNPQKSLTGKQVKELQKSLNKGRRLVEKDSFDKALPYFLEAWEYLPNDLDLLTVLAHCLNSVGVRDKAILVIERALKFHAPTPDIVSVIMNLALNMRIYDVAVKIGNILISMQPREARHYVNLATAYSAEERYDESIQMLQGIIPVFPENSDLWNVLATQVRARDGAEESVVFFKEAIRLSPNDFKIYSNLAMSYTQMGEWDLAVEADLKSIELNPKSPEPRLGLSVLYFFLGKLEEAWEHYEYRMDTSRHHNQSQIYTHKLPIWDGQPLKGKKVLLLAEQGIGDEVMWGNFFRSLEKEAGQLVIGCEPRLTSIYERSYPEAIVSPLSDVIRQGYRYRSFPKAQQMIKDGELDVDYAIPLASAPKFFWKKPEDVKFSGEDNLIVCPELKKKFKEKLDEISDKPKIGFAWRSGNKSLTRSYIYSSVKHFRPFEAFKDQVDFVNLQYDECSDELQEFEDRFGIKVHNLEGVDLKKDIEANLGIMANCDLVLSCVSAPAMFAMALGTETLIMSTSEPWWLFGNEGGKVPFVRAGHTVVAEKGEDWYKIVEKTSGVIQHKLGLK